MTEVTDISNNQLGSHSPLTNWEGRGTITMTDISAMDIKTNMNVELVAVMVARLEWEIS